MFGNLQGQALKIRATYVLIACSALLISLNGHTQQQTSPSMAVSANIGGPVFGHYEIGYTYKIAQKAALSIPLTFHYIPSAWFDASPMGDFPFHSLELGVGAKFYVVGNALASGIYIEPMTEGGYLARVDVNKPTLVIKESLRLGLTWVFDFGLMLDFASGLLFNFLLDPARLKKEQSEKIDRTSVLPAIKFSIGYVW